MAEILFLCINDNPLKAQIEANHLVAVEGGRSG